MLATPLDTEGRPIGPLRLHRALRLNIVAGTMIMASFAVISPGAVIMTIFLQEHLKASPAMIGLNVALFTFGPILSILGAPLFSSIPRRRPLWVILTAIGRAAYLPLPLAAILAHDPDWRNAMLILVIATGAICMASNGMTSVGWWSWMADLIPESIRGRFFGDRTKVLLIVGAIVPLVAGLLLDRFSDHATTLLAWMFLIAAILAILDPLLFAWVPEPRRDTAVVKLSLREVVRRYLDPLRDRGFRTFLLGVGIRMFAGSLPAPFLALYLRGYEVDGVRVGCGATYSVITFAGAVGTAAGVLCSSWWGMLADKVGHRPVFLMGCAGFVVQLGYGLLTPGNVMWLLPILNILANLIGVGAGVALSNLLIGVSPKVGREYYVALYTVVCGILTATAPWLGGLIGEAVPVLPLHLHNGQPMTYYHLLIAASLVLMLLSLPLTMRIPDARGDEVGISLMRLARGGMVRTIHQLSIIAQTDDPLRRARALGTMGSGAAAVALEEVSAALDDPSPQVRREAILALGRMGSDRALDLLVWCLHEPDSETRELAATALGEMPNQDGRLVLKGALSDPDPNVRAAAATALGRLGHPDAAERLRDLLRHDPISQVQVAAGRALAYLHDHASCEALADLATFHPHRLARSQLTIALGGLFSHSGDFYRLWRRDRTVPGMGFMKVGNRLRRAVKRLRGDSATRTRRIDLLRQMQVHAEACAWTQVLQGADDLLMELDLTTPAAQYTRLLVQRLLQHRQDPTSEDAIWDGLALAALVALEAALSAR